MTKKEASGAPQRIMMVVSACLAGERCRWDGEYDRDPEVSEMVRSGNAIAACPEVLGGLPVPREPAEIIGGDGDDVLEGRARIRNRGGEDVTEFFLQGARAFLQLVRASGARIAILRERSPSCGVFRTPDGSFVRRYRRGPGVAAALLRREGIRVIPRNRG